VHSYMSACQRDVIRFWCKLVKVSSLFI